MIRSNGLGRTLIACLREAGEPVVSPQLDAAFEQVDLDALAAEAARHRIAGVLLDRLTRSAQRDHDTVHRLRTRIARDAAWQLLVAAHLARITAAFDAERFPYAVVKGPVLAEHVYPDASWRTFTDLDLLVASSDAKCARELIEQLGGVIPTAQRIVTERGFDGEVCLYLPGGLNVDLHHEVVNDADVRRHFAVPIAELLRRTRTVELSGTPVPVLDPTDQLLHLCLHAAVSNGRRLVWLLDIDQAVRRDPPDLDRLVRRAARWRVGLPAAVMLERTRHILRTPVSDELLDELAPRGSWRRVCHLMLTLRPPQTETDAVLSGGVVVASTRDSTASSVRAMLRSMWVDGVRAPITNPAHPWRARLRGA